MTSFQPNSRVAWQSEVLPAASLTDEYTHLWRQWSLAQPALQRAFLSVEFFQSVARVHPRVRLAVLSRNGAPSVLFPFQFASPFHAALGWAEPLGFGASDYFGAICAPGVTITPDELLRASSLNYLYFDHLHQSQSLFGLQSGRPRAGLLIRLDDGPDAYWNDLAARDPDFMKDTLRRVRQLEAAHGPLQLLHNPPSPLPHLQRLIDAKRSQYSATGAPDPLLVSWRLNLLPALLDTDTPQCRHALSILFAGDTWVASHFGLQCGSRLHYWFPVYNPQLRRFSPGRVLLRSLICRATELSISTIDRGAGESTAKLDFANARDLYYTGAWQRSTLPAIFARTAQSLRWRFSRGPGASHIEP